jgi:hypothetical protein
MHSPPTSPTRCEPKRSGLQKKNWNALHWAAQNVSEDPRNLEMLYVLRDAGVDLKQRGWVNSFGFTPSALGRLISSRNIMVFENPPTSEFSPELVKRVAVDLKMETPERKMALKRKLH